MLEETLETLLSDPKDYIRMTRSLFSAMTPEQRTEWSELAAYHKDARAVLTSSQQEPGGVAPNVAIASASNKATAREPHHDAGALKSGVCGSPARKRALLERLEKTASDLEAANKRTSLPTEGGAGAAQRGSGTSGQGYFPEPPEDDEPTSPRSEKKRLREILKEVKTATKKRVRLEERALDKLLREQEREVLAAEKKLEKEHEQAIRAEAKREKAEKTRVEAEAKKERKRVEKEATDKQRAAERQEAKALAAEHRVAATAARETTAQAEKKYTKSLDISSGLCPYVRPANRNGLNAQPCGGKLERISNVVLREGVFGVQYECTRATGCPFVKRRFSHVG